MKKSLIALAVLAASGAAMAQSSVTVYGRVDLSVGSLKELDKGSQTKLFNGGDGGLTTSRLGFRGSEDLGGGLKAKFKVAATTRFGSGWAWLVKDTDGALKVTKTENGVNPLCFGQTALLGCDVWEHSYYIDFRNKRPAYLTNFLDKLVNWENVASRM